MHSIFTFLTSYTHLSEGSPFFLSLSMISGTIMDQKGNKGRTNGKVTTTKPRAPFSSKKVQHFPSLQARCLCIKKPLRSRIICLWREARELFTAIRVIWRGNQLQMQETWMLPPSLYVLKMALIHQKQNKQTKKLDFLLYILFEKLWKYVFHFRNISLKRG